MEIRGYRIVGTVLTLCNRHKFVPSYRVVVARKFLTNSLEYAPTEESTPVFITVNGRIHYALTTWN